MKEISDKLLNDVIEHIAETQYRIAEELGVTDVRNKEDYLAGNPSMPECYYNLVKLRDNK